MTLQIPEQKILKNGEDFCKILSISDGELHDEIEVKSFGASIPSEIIKRYIYTVELEKPFDRNQQDRYAIIFRNKAAHIISRDPIFDDTKKGIFYSIVTEREQPHPQPER